MLTKEKKHAREQTEMLTIEELVPKDHIHSAPTVDSEYTEKIVVLD